MNETTINTGIVVTFSAGWLKWPALFFILAFISGFSIVWMVLWLIVVADRPEANRWISTEDQNYILASQGHNMPLNV